MGACCPQSRRLDQVLRQHNIAQADGSQQIELHSGPVRRRRCTSPRGCRRAYTRALRVADSRDVPQTVRGSGSARRRAESVDRESGSHCPRGRLHSLRRHAVTVGGTTLGAGPCGAGCATTTGDGVTGLILGAGAAEAARAAPSLRYSPRNCLCRRMAKIPRNSAVVASRAANCPVALNRCCATETHASHNREAASPAPVQTDAACPAANCR